MDVTESLHCLGHSNWTICSPISQFCSPDFLTFSLLYWWAHSYYSRGLIMGKGNSPNSRNGRCRGFSVQGALKLDHLQPVELILFQNGFPLPITPEAKRIRTRYPNGKNDSILDSWSHSAPGTFEIKGFINVILRVICRVSQKLFTVTNLKKWR